MFEILTKCGKLNTNFNIKSNEEDMSHFREDEQRGKSLAESFLIGRNDLLPWSCTRKLVTYAGVICINELLMLKS